MGTESWKTRKVDDILDENIFPNPKCIKMKNIYRIPICLSFAVLSGIYIGCTPKGGNSSNRTIVAAENNDAEKNVERALIENDTLFEDKSFRKRKFLTLDDISSDDSALISAYVRKRDSCIQYHTCDSIGRDCSQNYCNVSECDAKIKCCHRIDSQTFEAMTHGGKYGWARFRKDQFTNTAAGALCGREKIRVRKDVELFGTYYRISQVDINTRPSSASEIDVFYSVPLIQGILTDNAEMIDSFILYTGFALDNKTRKLIPFEVTYKNGLKSKYYDVSDSQP